MTNSYTNNMIYGWGWGYFGPRESTLTSGRATDYGQSHRWSTISTWPSPIENSVVGVSYILPHAPLVLVDFNLFLFTVRNCNCEYNSFAAFCKFYWIFETEGNLVDTQTCSWCQKWRCLGDLLNIAETKKS